MKEEGEIKVRSLLLPPLGKMTRLSNSFGEKRIYIAAAGEFKPMRSNK